jgi:hypothetical protein
MGAAHSLLSTPGRCEADDLDGFVPELAAGASETLNSKEKRPNPGQYDQKDMDAKKCLNVDTFEGMRFDTNIQLSLGQFVVGHGFMMGPPPPPNPQLPRGSPPEPASTYHFTSTYINGETQLFGRIGADGMLDARLYNQVTPNILCKVQTALQPAAEYAAARVDVDFKGEDYTTNLRMANGWQLGGSYWQSLTQKLALGGDAMYSGEHQAMSMSCAARWTDPDWLAVGAYTLEELAQPGRPLHITNLHYVRKVSDRVNLASELIYVGNTNMTKVNVGAEVTLRQSRLNACVDQSGRIKSSLEALLFGPFKFLLSAEMHHASDEFKFGFGISSGQ